METTYNVVDLLAFMLKDEPGVIKRIEGVFQ